MNHNSLIASIFSPIISGRVDLNQGIPCMPGYVQIAHAQFHNSSSLRTWWVSFLGLGLCRES